MSVSPEITSKIVNLMQFARKAGKLVSGTDACLRAIHGKGLHLIIIAEDTAERTVKRIINATAENGGKIPVINLGKQTEISAALGLPITAIFGVLDKQFAAKMKEYYAA
jgi:ribosomal protein L7Ae-like RNA K-turn-binding protein